MLYTKLDKIKTEINKEKVEIETKIESIGVKLFFSKPRIILKSSEEYKIISKSNKSHVFYITEETPFYIKVLPYKSDKLLDLEKFEAEINSNIIKLKNKILENISKKVFEKTKLILKAFQYIRNLDSYLTKVNFAIEINGIKPEISYNEFYINKGINLYLKTTLEKQGLDYIPLNIKLKKGLGIITGSNMGGKTVVLKTIAQITYMVHSGLMIPAKEAKVPLFNGIFISKNADDFR